MKQEFKQSPYGSWKTPVTAELYSESFIGVEEPFLSNGEIYWKETRPREGGRYVIVKSRGAKVSQLTPKGFNVRDTVHEYGGGDYVVHGEPGHNRRGRFFSAHLPGHGSDQRGDSGNRHAECQRQFHGHSGGDDHLHLRGNQRSGLGDQTGDGDRDLDERQAALVAPAHSSHQSAHHGASSARRPAVAGDHSDTATLPLTRVAGDA